MTRDDDIAELEDKFTKILYDLGFYKTTLDRNFDVGERNITVNQLFTNPDFNVKVQLKLEVSNLNGNTSGNLFVTADGIPGNSEFSWNEDDGMDVVIEEFKKQFFKIKDRRAFDKKTK